MTGYAVVDVQTTGLDPARHDRVVELGVAVLDERAELVEEWVTLVDPERDVGPTNLHGITARDVLGAPTFAEIAPRLVAAVDGRLVVAHNARFDMLFLAAELRRAALPLQGYPPLALCTMELASLYLPGSRRSLEACCKTAGIELTTRFSSAHQVRATATLLRHYLVSAGGVPWEELAAVASRYLWPLVVSTETELRPRAERARPQPSSAWLERIVELMPRIDHVEVEAYLAALEMALLDRYLSQREEDSLVGLAGLLGLGRDQLAEVHREYLRTMAAVALEDDVVTAGERDDLALVARLLGLPDAAVDEALAVAAGAPAGTGFRLVAGDRVCLTGSTRTPREELERSAARHGLVVGGLTRHTRLLVAADPDSTSGKARKAVAYGVPVVTEDAFLAMLDRVERPAAQTP